MSTLFVVATPIGQLDDLSIRAKQVLSSVAVIAAEDTRRSGLLLSELGIETRLIACHDHNEANVTDGLLQLLEEGSSVALISDAGTPLISDPGFTLVRACLTAGIQVVPIPGPSALTAALSVSGLPTDRFSFEGFLASKNNAKEKQLRDLQSERRTMVFFEAPHRVQHTVAMIADIFGESRPMSVCRELTKTYEQIVSGTASEVLDQLESGTIVQKGEFVLVVGGNDEMTRLDSDELLRELIKELPPTKAASIAARLTGHTRSELYDRAMQLRS